MRALLNNIGSCADLDKRDNKGYTPFMVACAGGHVDVVTLLCSAGCNCSLRNEAGLVRQQNIDSPHTYTNEDDKHRFASSRFLSISGRLDVVCHHRVAQSRSL